MLSLTTAAGSVNTFSAFFTRRFSQLLLVFLWVIDSGAKNRCLKM